MKKVIIGAASLVFVFSMVACGHGPGCDAYGGQKDYTKNKLEHSKKIEMVQDLLASKK